MMLDMGVIKPSETERAVGIVFAPKEDGSLRLCVGYRRLKAVIVRESYPKQRMDECIGSSGDVLIFSALFHNSGCWQVGIDDANCYQTVFTSHHGLYRFVKMPSGLRNVQGWSNEPWTQYYLRSSKSMPSYILTMLLYFHGTRTNTQCMFTP